MRTVLATALLLLMTATVVQADEPASPATDQTEQNVGTGVPDGANAGTGSNATTASPS
jgi:hypothetical protein